MARIDLNGISKTYASGVVGLGACSLSVDDGSLTVIVGPSGSGKTTILRLIAGLDRATTGTIAIDGQCVDRRPPRERKIAMVFQDDALYPHLSVFQNMALPLKMSKTPRAEIMERVNRTAESLAIDGLFDRKPDELSGGERQRTALGRALVRRPGALLLDEPFSNLEPRLRDQMRTELKKLHGTLGTTMIHVTHDQEEAMALADMLIVLDEGLIQQIGSPLEVYESPANLMVASFLGSPAMNCIPVGVDLSCPSQVRLKVNEDCELSLPRSHWPDLERYDGGRLILGLRPHAIGLAADGPSLSAGDTARLGLGMWTVESLLHLGDRCLAVLGHDQGSARLVAILPTDLAPDTGTSHEWSASLDEIHLFEPGSHGIRLGNRDRGIIH